MGVPCYDPDTGLPEYNKNAPNPNLPVVKITCPCTSGVAFSVPLGAGLTGCTTGNCGAFTGNWGLTFNNDNPDASQCAWLGGDTGGSYINLIIYYAGNAEMVLGYNIPGEPADEVCWRGTAAAITCIGNTVFSRTAGTCTGPATITITGA